MALMEVILQRVAALISSAVALLPAMPQLWTSRIPPDWTTE